MSAKLAYTIAEVAEMLSLSTAAVYREINQGKIRTLQAGTGSRARRISHVALVEYIDAREAEAVLPRESGYGGPGRPKRVTEAA